MSASDIISQAKHKTGYLNEQITINQKIGGEKALNGIAKIAINYFVYISKEFDSIENIIEVLKNETKNKLCKHFYPEKLYKKESKEICHLVHIESNKYHKNLIAYIELFSSYSFMILLSDDYSGKKIKSTYCYDLNHRRHLTKDISLKITTENFKILPVISKDYYNTITEKMDRIVKIGLEKQTDREVSSISERCVDDILKVKYGHEKVITKQMLSELSYHLATEFMKFIYRDLK